MNDQSFAVTVQFSRWVHTAPREPTLVFDLLQAFVLVVLAALSAMVLDLPRWMYGYAMGVGLALLLMLLVVTHSAEIVRSRRSGADTGHRLPATANVLLSGPRSAVDRVLRLAARAPVAGVFRTTPLGRGLLSFIALPLISATMLLRWLDASTVVCGIVGIGFLPIVLLLWVGAGRLFRLRDGAIQVYPLLDASGEPREQVTLHGADIRCDLGKGVVSVKGAQELTINLRNLLRPNSFVAALIAAVRVDEAGATVDGGGEHGRGRPAGSVLGEDAMLTVTQPEDLQKVTALLHDLWFSVEDIVHDSQNSTWRVFLADVDRRFAVAHSSFRGHPGVLTLVVEYVESVVIEDTEQIEHYDVHSVVYDARTRRLTLVTNIPLRIDITVERLCVRVFAGARD